MVRAELVATSGIILDPDFGVVVPYDTAAIQANPELVRPAYANMAALYYPDAKEPYTTDHVVEIYGKEGNHVYTVDNKFEYFSYWAIWIIPFLLMLPYAIKFSEKAKLYQRIRIKNNSDKMMGRNFSLLVVLFFTANCCAQFHPVPHKKISGNEVGDNSTRQLCKGRYNLCAGK